MDFQVDYLDKFTEVAKVCSKLSSNYLTHQLARRISSLIDSVTSPACESLTELMNQLAPRESAEFHLSLGIGLISLYKAHLRCQGVDEKNHAISQEDDRLASYLAKMKLADDRRILVDASSTKRIVSYQLSSFE